MNDLRKLLHYFRPYKISLITGIACIMAGVVFNVSIPLIVGNVIDANWNEVTWAHLTIAALKVLGASAAERTVSLSPAPHSHRHVAAH